MTATLAYDHRRDRTWVDLDAAAAAKLDAAPGEVVLVRIDDRDYVGVVGSGRGRVWLVAEPGGFDVDAVGSVTVRRRRRA